MHDMDELTPPYKPNIWKKFDECYPDWRKMEQKELGIRWINVDRITGTLANTDKFWSGRFLGNVKLLRNKEYDFSYPKPSVLFKVNNEYFVATDGNHRVLAFKYLGIKKIKAKVVKLI